jgi:hypothetical protein
MSASAPTLPLRLSTFSLALDASPPSCWIPERCSCGRWWWKGWGGAQWRHCQAHQHTSRKRAVCALSRSCGVEMVTGSDGPAWPP